jgi:hypothetical protein
MRISIPLFVLLGCKEPVPRASSPPSTVQPIEAEGIDLAVDADGVAWASWVSDGAVFVARSTGGPFEEPVRVTEPGVAPTVGTARRPHLAVDDARIAVTFTDGVSPQADVWLYVAERESLVFSKTLLAKTGVHDTLDQSTVVFDGGEIWTAWKVGTDHDYGIVLARESQAFDPVYVTGFPGQPCECCPHELTVLDGTPILVQRGNESDLRDIYLGFVDDLGAADVHRVSWNGWIVPGCPYDGPVTARTGSGRWVATWVDATQGDARAWVSRSDDGGRLWDTAEVVLPDTERSHAWPQVVASSDRLWLTVEEIWQRTHLLESADGGQTWVERLLDEDLVDAQLASGGGLTGLMGLNADDELVWSVLENAR